MLLRARTAGVIALALVAGVGCESTPTTPGEAPDEAPTCYEASPDVYELLDENAMFRVITATWAPGQRDEWHTHPPLAAYFLTDVRGTLHYPDGSATDVTGRVGEVRLLENHETHWFENTGDLECRMVLFERMHSGLAPELPVDARPRCEDASPEVYQVVAENGLMRVISAVWEPGKQDEWHSHPPLAAYFLTEVQGRLRFEMGSDREVQAPAGAVSLADKPESHAFQHLGEDECRIVIVELG